MIMKKVSVTIVDDNQWEPDEEFFLKLALVKKVLNHFNEYDIRIFIKCPKAIANVAYDQLSRCRFQHTNASLAYSRTPYPTNPGLYKNLNTKSYSPKLRS